MHVISPISLSISGIIDSVTDLNVGEFA
jgi:hypothetical protein